VDGTHPGGKEPHTGPAVTREATLIAGDGVGPEITAATLLALAAFSLAWPLVMRVVRGRPTEVPVSNEEV